MDELLKLINAFEKRNNISITIIIYGDGSCSVEEFWENENLFEGKTPKGLFRFLKNVNYKLDPVYGRCLSPVQRIKKTRH